MSACSRGRSPTSHCSADVLAGYDAGDAGHSARCRTAAVGGCSRGDWTRAPYLAFVPTPVWDSAEASTQGAFSHLVETLGECITPVKLPDGLAKHMLRTGRSWRRSLALNYGDLWERGRDSDEPDTGGDDRARQDGHGGRVASRCEPGHCAPANNRAFVRALRCDPDAGCTGRGAGGLAADRQPGILHHLDPARRSRRSACRCFGGRPACRWASSLSAAGVRTPAC